MIHWKKSKIKPIIEAKPKVGDTKTVRKFLWLPKLNEQDGEYYWLGHVDVIYTWKLGYASFGFPFLPMQIYAWFETSFTIIK